MTQGLPANHYSGVEVMNIVKKIYADGRIEDCDQKMTLEEMQKFVGGYIEICPSNIAR